MCLAIPALIVQIGPEPSLAVVEVFKVRRKVNIDLLRSEGIAPGDWVLVHVGFAMTKIAGEQAEEQLRLLRLMGEEDQGKDEFTGYVFGAAAADRGEP